MRMLEAYDWPGNVRELRNVIERATILARGEFIEPHAPAAARRAAAHHRPARRRGVTITPGMTVDEAERKLILATLEAAGNNKTRAAEMLGISLKTLHNKLNRMKETESNVPNVPVCRVPGSPVQSSAAALAPAHSAHWHLVTVAHRSPGMPLSIKQKQVLGVTSIVGARRGGAERACT